jgi:large subunit ribosomal protein L35
MGSAFYFAKAVYVYSNLPGQPGYSKEMSSPMPKVKTHKGAQQRFKITGTGKVLRMHGQKSHLRRRKASRATSQYDKMSVVSPALAPHIKDALPNGLPK